MKFLQTLFKPVLIPIYMLYKMGTVIRNLLYDKGILKSVKLSVPVISVGNITVGGTGKTPFTISLANKLKNDGYRVGIITRGYKRKSKGQIIVSSGEGPEHSSEICGDEPFLIAQKTEGIVIIADKNRVEAGKIAINKFHCNIILADDGFQHRKLVRDVNIVLWDSYTDPYKENLIPIGRLRESFRGLNRASFVILTRNSSSFENLNNFFKYYNQQSFTSPTIIDNLSNPYNKQKTDPSNINNKSVYAFCGLGNSEQFFDTIKKLNPKKLITAKFPDHHKYSKHQILQIQKQGEDTNCDFILTTEKDFANFPKLQKSVKKLLLVSITMEISHDLFSEIENGWS